MGGWQGFSMWGPGIKKAALFIRCGLVIRWLSGDVTNYTASSPPVLIPHPACLKP
jgi:hypothetical protein